MQETPARASLGRRFVALLVLLVAGWILLKVVIGLIAGLATFIVIVAAIGGVLWALKTI